MLLRKTLVSLAMALCSVPMVGCSGEGAALRIAAAENVSSSSSALASATTPIAPPTFQSSDGVTFTLTQARTNLRDIRLDLPKGTKCEDVRATLSLAQCKGGESGAGSGTLVIPGPIVVDLLTGATTPDLSALRIPAGTYKRIDFRIDDGEASALPAGDELIGRSFIVRADFQNGTSPATLELLLKFNEDARFESATGVTIEQGDSTLLTLLSPSVWLEGLPLKKCLDKGDVSLTNGVLRIDDKAKGDCSGAEDAVKRNIKRSGDLRKH